MTDPRDDGHASAERQGRRDMTTIGFGIVIFGIVAFLGALAAVAGLTPSKSDSAAVVWFTVFYGAIVLVFAGSMVAGFGIRAGRGANSGVAGGCGSAALSVGLGLLLFLAAFSFMFVTCFVAVMSSLSKNLK